MKSNDGDKLTKATSGELTDAGTRELLGGLAPPRHAANAPGREKLLATVAEPAGMARRPVLRLAFSGLALAAIVVVAWWAAGRLAHPGQPPSGLLAPDTAWAAVDSVVLEYPLKFDDYFSGTILDPPDHPVWLLNNKVEQWAAAHGISTEPSSSEPYVQVKLAEYTYGGKGNSTYKGLVQVMLIEIEDEMLDSLLANIDMLEWLPKPKVYSESLYLSQKYPNSFFIGRRVIINGSEFVYPQDFTEDEARSLYYILRTTPEASGHEYIVSLKVGSTDRFPLADVVKVQYGDPLFINDYAEHFDRDQLNLLSFQPTVAWLPNSEEARSYDPLEMLARIGDVDKLEYYRTQYLGRKGYKLVADLSSDNSREYVSAIRDAAQAWAANYPEIAAGGELAHLLAVEPVEADGKLVQVQVRLWINDQQLAEDLFSAVRELCPGRTRVWRALPTLEETRGEAKALRLKSVK